MGHFADLNVTENQHRNIFAKNLYYIVNHSLTESVTESCFRANKILARSALIVLFFKWRVSFESFLANAHSEHDT